ncbi:LEAF RUST 10 DISEASE-RESISTANCE LOCUS RECEPTOR-LIKE PROTEIN KINASE-like 1.2 isoform X2 [Lotus japonicus]|uniref:LEAF RUST 10 DISEASE-RESISTANCE LOCUS RECEPTOR-LIKE PROTEIN KINASE-like 1.2 isoform X2 n=1 Tax=Lotus japonicus TaxID=34305 RepID=UPI0025905598|nr:LEAF RUST 10 DISEASE-RESISTANCE LOCUS RECEPTOR-LIKE PROTEIN KINASE-like 1.2 isoform X2 [Lotus japonicus]
MCVRMDEHIHIHVRFSMLFPSIFTTITLRLFLLTCTLPHYSHSQPLSPPVSNFSICEAESYNCGTLTGISYPFWGQNRPSYCGGGDMFNLNCQPDLTTTTTTVVIGSQTFTVLAINPDNNTMTMKLTDFNVCSPKQFDDTFLIGEVFQYATSVSKITIFYNCSNSGKNFSGCGQQKYAFGHVDMDLNEEELKRISKDNQCTGHIKVPVGFSLEPYYEKGVIDRDDLEQGLDKGFEVKYYVNPDCMSCLGREEINCPWRGDDFDKQVASSCHYCSSRTNAASHCPVPIFIPTPTPTPTPTTASPKRKMKLKVIIGVSSAVVGALAVILGIYVYKRKKNISYAKSSYVQSRSLSSDLSLNDTEKGSRYYGVHLFTYTELEEATNNFDSSKELGEGGFGTVYFGKLRDGRCVAVKRLYENNCRRVEQFMNEVEILIRVVHPNLVSLYGCTSRHSRELLLVYEYISNGTVADHLHGKQANPGKISWRIRMNIAVETASALKYLHASEIIHRDVKTNNILLDNHFRVKVADFGLSRLFPEDVTHVSTAPQGTPGYVDPEYHECYQLTSKSDVYSFGVVLIELISSLPAVDITRHRHEINLANMAINKIQKQALHELVDPTLGFESDFKARKMINAVAELAFQCLQSSKDMRPSMDEVLDSLQDIQSDGKFKSQPEVMDISTSADDDVVLLKDDPPPPSPDSIGISKSTTPNASG